MKELSQQAKIDRLMCNRSLYYLCKEVLGYKDMVPHVHGFICDFATHAKYGRFRQGCVPRSWFKTWVWTVGKSIWLVLPDDEEVWKNIYPHKGPNCRILIASNVIDNAAKMIHKIKSEFENNDRLQAAFPELIPDFNKTRWSDHCAEIVRKVNATEGTWTAVGVGGSVISQHFDHILEDDLVYAKKDDFTGQELMPSQEDIDNAIGWHKLTFSLFSDPNTSTADNVGTRWAPHDLVDYIRNKEGHYQCFEITATKGAQWPIPDNSYCIWPERYHKKSLETIRDSQGPKIFETQYLNRPRAGEDVTFDVSYIDQVPTLADFPQGLKYYTFVDLASWKDKKRICKNVILTGAKDSRNNIWVARVDAGKFNPSEVIQFMKAHKTQFNSKVMVEEVGYQVALAHFARKEMETPGSEWYNIDTIPNDNRSGAKILRIEALEPMVKNGALHILKSLKDLRQELEDYPYGVSRDIIDCLGFLWRYSTPAVEETYEQTKTPFSFESLIEEFEDRATANRLRMFEDPLLPRN